MDYAKPSEEFIQPPQLKGVLYWKNKNSHKAHSKIKDDEVQSLVILGK